MLAQNIRILVGMPLIAPRHRMLESVKFIFTKSDSDISEAQLNMVTIQAMDYISLSQW